MLKFLGAAFLVGMFGLAVYQWIATAQTVVNYGGQTFDKLMP